VAPAAFSLLFNHPLSLDPERLGFAPQPLHGQHTYVAPLRTRAAAPGSRGAVGNLLRVSEVTAQKRFRLHATPPPPMVALVVDSACGTIALRTHINGLPFAHGCCTGDVVTLGHLPSPLPPLMGADGTSTTPAESSTTLLPCSALVEASSSPDDPCLLRLRVPAFEGLGDVGTALQVACTAEPWNLCFCKPHTLPSHLVGFPRAALQYDRDGSVGDGDGRRLPPFEAPATHSLDHPDYVLISLAESSGATLESSYGGETRPVFCKLSLYPLFREERMLPRDTSLLRDRLSRFTLRFLNPDFSPYRFHGAEFSFSLAFFSAVPDGP
jgi:hypothetical protein